MRKSIVLCWLLLPLSCSQQTLQLSEPELHWDDIHEANFKSSEVAPAPYSDSVGVLEPIRFRFGQAVIADSITEQAVKLVPLQRSFDWRHEEELSHIKTRLELKPTEIVIHPLHPMQYGAEYALLVNGVLGVNGNQLYGHVTWFRTRINPAVEKITYKQGAPFQRETYEWSAQQRTASFLYDARGTSSDSDDQLISVTRISQAIGDREADVTFDTAGSVASYRWASSSATTGKTDISFNSPGNNGRWGDHDDEMNALSDHRFVTQNMSLVRRFHINTSQKTYDPSLANLRMDYAEVRIFDEQRYLVQKIRYEHLGFGFELDLSSLGELYPIDDKISYYELYRYDPQNGTLLQVDRFEPPTGSFPDFLGRQGQDSLTLIRRYNRGVLGYLSSIEELNYNGGSQAQSSVERIIYSDPQRRLRQESLIYKGNREIPTNLQTKLVFNPDF